jgi:hypothetical protein
MDDSNLVDVLDAGDELMEHAGGFRLTDTFVLDDIVEELALFHELHNKEELFGSFDDFVKLHNVRVPDEL